jgi:dienelactone hydrolase
VPHLRRRLTDPKREASASPSETPDERRIGSVRGQRSIAVGLLLLVTAAVTVTVALSSGGSAQRRHGARTAATRSAEVKSKPRPAPAPSSFAVGLRVSHLVDPSRPITLPDGSTRPRALVTYVRYPAVGTPGSAELSGAPAARAWGPFPLVVFGHGFDVTPALYSRLLHAWAQAGYVVVAPAFPLESPSAPGGPDESDLTNQPADIRFVISRMLASSRLGSDPLAGMIDPSRIAVSGHSDGGDTALAVAYDSRYRDSRVGAAVILSGAEIPAAGTFTFPPGGPPLLASQGTADTVNPVNLTEAFFEAAGRPKYLLRLLGAEHLPPYTDQQPQLGIVERVTLAFLDGYLKRRASQLQRLGSLGSVPGTASLLAEP